MSRIGNGVAKVALPENWANVPSMEELNATEVRLQNNIDTGDAALQSNIEAETTRATERETELNNKFNSYTPTINIPGIKVDNAGYADTATKATQDANGKDIDATYAKKENSYTREEIDQKVASVYKYMGSVATKEELLALPTESLVIGYVYDVKSTGLNYAWNGTSWDELGMEIDLSLYAKKTDVPGIKVDNAGHADNADEAVNSAKLGNTDASEYALKIDIPQGLKLQSVLDVSHPVGSGYTPVADETPMQLFNGDTFKSWWNETSKGSKKWQRVRQEDFRVPQIDTLGSGRNLVTVLNASSVQDAFAKLKQRVISRDYSGLMLGDYLDIPSINTGSRSGAGTILNKRFEIGASDFYDYGGDLSNPGILFIAKEVLFKHRMNPTNDNTGGYLASELYPIINEDFTAGLTEAIGFEPKEIHRSLDNGYGSSTVNWSTEKVFIPTEMEMFGNWTYGMTTKPKHINLQNIQQFPIYQKRGGNSGRVKNFEGSTWYYWESSSYKDSSTYFARVGGGGSADYGSASGTGHGVSPAFYIG